MKKLKNMKSADNRTARFVSALAASGLVTGGIAANPREAAAKPHVDVAGASAPGVATAVDIDDAVLHVEALLGTTVRN